jgi:hypothetical protein
MLWLYASLGPDKDSIKKIAKRFYIVEHIYMHVY